MAFLGLLTSSGPMAAMCAWWEVELGRLLIVASASLLTSCLAITLPLDSMTMINSFRELLPRCESSGTVATDERSRFRSSC